MTESQVQQIKDSVESAVRTRAALEDYFSDFLRHMREGEHDMLMLGPVVQGSEDHFGFVHLSGRLLGPSNYENSYAGSREMAESLRNALWKLATHHRDGLIIHSFDDELIMAKMADTLWPGQYADIVKGIERERQETGR